MAVKDKMSLICGTLWTLDKIFVSVYFVSIEQEKQSSTSAMLALTVYTPICACHFAWNRGVMGNNILQ
jgi:hypothetical protein